jgi:type VI secretion system protein VasD
MTLRRPRLVLLSMLAAAAIAAACGKAPPPAPPAPMTITVAPEAKVKAAMSIAVSADANPDVNGRPSPVYVYVYQLKADAAFKTADFVGLTDDREKVLGEALISYDEFFLKPSDKRMVDMNVANDAAFVGVVAGFQDIRNAVWRAVVPAPRKGLTIAVERARVVVSRAE